MDEAEKNIAKLLLSHGIAALSWRRRLHHHPHHQQHHQQKTNSNNQNPLSFYMATVEASRGDWILVFIVISFSKLHFLVERIRFLQVPLIIG